MKSKKRTLIIDDHPVVHEGLKSIIGRSSTFEVIGGAGGSREGLGMAVELKPDIILLDISLPDGDGTDLIREIRTVLPEVIFLMISFHTDTRYVVESFQAGATGYHVKGSSPETLLEALETVSSGGYFFDGPMSPEGVERMKNLTVNGPKDAVSRYEALTGRQKQVLRLLVQGLPYKTIAHQLNISEATVGNHRAQIMAKLGVKNRAELIRFATELNKADMEL